jgi:hypothetical protein
LHIAGNFFGHLFLAGVAVTFFLHDVFCFFSSGLASSVCGIFVAVCRLLRNLNKHMLA